MRTHRSSQSLDWREKRNTFSSSHRSTILTNRGDIAWQAGERQHEVASKSG